MSVERDQGVRITWRSDDETARHIVEFIRVVFSATFEGLATREAAAKASMRTEKRAG